MRGSNGSVLGIASRNSGTKLSPLSRESEESSDSDSLGKYLRDEVIGLVRDEERGCVCTYVGGFSPTLSMMKLMFVC